MIEIQLKLLNNFMHIIAIKTKAMYRYIDAYVNVKLWVIL